GGAAGQIFYLERPQAGTGRFAQLPANLMRYDLSKRKSEQASGGVFAYFLNSDGKKALTFAPPETWTVIDTASPAPATPGKGKLNIDAVEVRIDPRAEWQQIFNEAWRINRDYFYDPNMHGCDWPAMKKKYAEFLPHLSSRGDLDRVIRWMLSELAVGHSFLA